MMSQLADDNVIGRVKKRREANATLSNRPPGKNASM
jgi:hypothetical protein